MSQSGIAINPECVATFNELKLGKKLRYLILKIDDSWKEVVVEEKSEDSDWETFRTKLLDAKSTHKGKTGKGPRYAIYDFHYTVEEGAGQRTKLTFIAWSPDVGAPMLAKMSYATTKEAVKNALNGLQGEIQANEEDDLEYERILQHVSKGKH